MLLKCKSIFTTNANLVVVYWKLLAKMLQTHKFNQCLIVMLIFIQTGCCGRTGEGSGRAFHDRTMSCRSPRFLRFCMNVFTLLTITCGGVLLYSTLN